MKRSNASERILSAGSADGSPAPVGDPPTGTVPSHVAKGPFLFPRTFVLVPSGRSPDARGGSLVLPRNEFPKTRRGFVARRHAGWIALMVAIVSGCGPSGERAGTQPKPTSTDQPVSRPKPKRLAHNAAPTQENGIGAP